MGRGHGRRRGHLLLQEPVTCWQGLAGRDRGHLPGPIRGRAPPRPFAGPGQPDRRAHRLQRGLRPPGRHGQGHMSSPSRRASIRAAASSPSISARRSGSTSRTWRGRPCAGRTTWWGSSISWPGEGTRSAASTASSAATSPSGPECPPRRRSKGAWRSPSTRSSASGSTTSSWPGWPEGPRTSSSASTAASWTSSSTSTAGRTRSSSSTAGRSSSIISPSSGRTSASWSPTLWSGGSWPRPSTTSGGGNAKKASRS